jgi:hypothetical protein
MLPLERAELQTECCELVEARLPKSALPGISDLITPEVIGALVRTGLDAAVAHFGEQGKTLSQQAKTTIRTFVSSGTLAYLEEVIRGLEDLKTAHAG